MRYVWKALLAGTAGPLIWFLTREQWPLWLTAVAISLAAVAVFRLAPPRPASTPRRDLVVTLGTVAAAIAAGLAIDRF